MDSSIQAFTSGVQNLLANEIIEQSAASDSLNFVTQDGRLKLVGGRKLVGTEGAAGMIRGLTFGYKADGTKIMWRKIETKIQYLDANGVWQDTITGLTSGADYVFSNYSSPAGCFTFAFGIDGIYKMNNANPGSYISLYDSTKNFKGFGLIDKSRCFMWNVPNNKTTLYMSHVDIGPALWTVVTSEAVGSSGSKTYTGTLAFKAGGATRNCFKVIITGNVAAGLETFTDYNGVLTGDKGGTGTINYISGAYSVTFSAITTGAVTVSYLWEDSNAAGLTDFTYSATRLTNEGRIVPQDGGGDAIMIVLVGQDGRYYSLKKQSVYRVSIASDDLSVNNEVFYQNMGLPSQFAAYSTSYGIMFMNTANPLKPEMTILEKNPIGDNILPKILFTSFKFSNYDFSDSFFFPYERYIAVSCKTQGAGVNDTILLCSISGATVDPIGYAARMFAKDDSTNFFCGSPFTQTVYQIFNGFDDLDDPILAHWDSRGEKYFDLKSRSSRAVAISDTLKKFRKFRVKGLIDPNQTVEVWMSFDDSDFQLVGTILGNGSYVDYNHPQAIGNNFIGEAQIGGDDISNAYPFFMEMKVKMPKFRKRMFRFLPKGIGYFDVNFTSDFDLMLFENRLPKRFRTQQRVGLDGKLIVPVPIVPVCVPEYGPELIGQWTIGNLYSDNGDGSITLSPTAEFDAYAMQDGNEILNGHIYHFNFNIGEGAGKITVVIEQGDVGTLLRKDYDPNQMVSFDILYSGPDLDDTEILFYTDPNGFSGNISNISLKEVTTLCPLSIVSLEIFDDIETEYNSLLEYLGLPTTINAVLSDNSQFIFPINWDGGNPTFDGSVAGNYVFSGAISLPDNITNPNDLFATINVIVDENES